MAKWPFRDSPDTAVIIDRRVLSSTEFISHVSHDLDDGPWQFLTNSTNTRQTNDARVVGLGSVVQLDPSVKELADLPLGWQASRTSPSSPWKRFVIS